MWGRRGPSGQQRFLLAMSDSNSRDDLFYDNDDLFTDEL